MQKTALQKLFVHEFRTSKLASFFTAQGRSGGEERLKSFTILVAEIVLLSDKGSSCGNCPWGKKGRWKVE